MCGIGTNGPEHDYLNRGCVPVYDKTATTCCPIEWRCRKYIMNMCILKPTITTLKSNVFPLKYFSIATSNDVVKKSGVIANSNMKCQFGDFTLGLLDHVLYEGGDNLNCKCYTPPMVSNNSCIFSLFRLTFHMRYLIIKYNY